MAERAGGPFREKSLERLSSPERLDQLLRVVDRKSWIPLVTLALIVLAILLWSVVGQIPENVEGRGILIRPRGIVEIHSPGSGYVGAVEVRVGDDVLKGDVLARIKRPDLENKVVQQQRKLDQLTALRLSGSILGEGSPQGVAGGAESVGEHVDAVRELALDIRDRELKAIRAEKEQLERHHTQASELAEARKQRFSAQQALREQGIVSETQRLEVEEAWLDSLSRVVQLDAQLRQLITRELEVEDRYLNRLQRIADFTLEIQDYEQQISDVEREIAQLQVSLTEEGRIVAEQAGRILELSIASGRFVGPGARLGSMEVSSSPAELQSLVYFTVRDGKRLRLEDTEGILITPDTVERARYGGIRGHIRDISPFPVTLAEAEIVIGNRDVAETLIDGGYRIQVFATLDRSNEGDLVWSSSKGPDHELTVGTTTTARVAVQRRRPITFVLPFLRELTGTD